jgi:hypothetical protein
MDIVLELMLNLIGILITGLVIYAICYALYLIFEDVFRGKPIKIERKDIEVTIIGKHYRGMYVSPMKVGKSTTMITHPSVYEILVEYNGTEFTINDFDTYQKYKDKVGEAATGVLEVCTYKDGSKTSDFIYLH